MHSFFKDLSTGVRITLLLAVLTGLAYPLAMTGVAQVAFNGQANGSLVTNAKGTTIGSSLIGQCFYKTTKDSAGDFVYQTTKDDQGNSIFVADPRYFQSRPSFTVDSNGNPLPCNAENSTGSNLGPDNPKLISRIKGYTDYLYSLGVAVNPDGTKEPMPIDLVTGDFTGFDPDITEAGALAQVNMVAKARNMPAATVRALVESNVVGRDLGLFGSPYVDVLTLNLALDASS
jgi:K+-transporting ATPase ATPase C chain